MVCRLRYHVPLSTHITISILFVISFQYFVFTTKLGRAAKSYLNIFKILLNKILRTILFCPSQSPTNLLYSKLKALKLDYMINMKIAKFIFKFSDQVLSDFFNNCFPKLDNVHIYNTRQKIELKFSKILLLLNQEKNLFIISV